MCSKITTCNKDNKAKLSLEKHFLCMTDTKFEQRKDINSTKDLVLYTVLIAA